MATLSRRRPRVQPDPDFLLAELDLVVPWETEPSGPSEADDRWQAQDRADREHRDAMRAYYDSILGRDPVEFEGSGQAFPDHWHWCEAIEVLGHRIHEPRPGDFL